MSVTPSVATRSSDRAITKKVMFDPSATGVKAVTEILPASSKLVRSSSLGVSSGQVNQGLDHVSKGCSDVLSVNDGLVEGLSLEAGVDRIDQDNANVGTVGALNPAQSGCSSGGHSSAKSLFHGQSSLPICDPDIAGAR